MNASLLISAVTFVIALLAFIFRDYNPEVLLPVQLGFAWIASYCAISFLILKFQSRTRAP